jgi:hypothetical protein
MTAFSNGTEHEIWAANWCDRCQRDALFRNDIGPGCPIIAVALLGDTPPEWIEQAPGSLDRDHCIVFRGPGGRRPEPQPRPDPPDMDGLFERPDRANRMLTPLPDPTVHAHAEQPVGGYPSP